jgi:hypothetical protein
MDGNTTSEIEEAYEEYEKMIYSVAHKFYKKYGGELKLIQAEARYFFVEAFHSYFEADGRFSTWLYFCIWHGLQGAFFKYPKSVKPTESFDHKIHEGKKQKEFYLCDIMDSLSEEGQKIVQLVFHPPAALQKRILNTGSHPHNVRAGIKKFLSEEMQWSPCQINNAFKEVRYIICSN